MSSCTTNPMTGEVSESFAQTIKEQYQNMDESLMKDQQNYLESIKYSFVIVPRFVYSKLKLSGNTALVFSIILGFNLNANKPFYGSTLYLEEFFNLSHTSVINILSSLVADGLLIKFQNKQDRNVYMCNLPYLVEVVFAEDKLNYKVIQEDSSLISADEREHYTTISSPYSLKGIEESIGKLTNYMWKYYAVVDDKSTKGIKVYIEACINRAKNDLERYLDARLLLTPETDQDKLTVSSKAEIINNFTEYANKVLTVEHLLEASCKCIESQPTYREEEKVFYYKIKTLLGEYKNCTCDVNKLLSTCTQTLLVYNIYKTIIKENYTNILFPFAKAKEIQETLSFKTSLTNFTNTSMLPKLEETNIVETENVLVETVTTSTNNTLEEESKTITPISLTNSDTLHDVTSSISEEVESTIPMSQSSTIDITDRASVSKNIDDMLSLSLARRKEKLSDKDIINKIKQSGVMVKEDSDSNTLTESSRTVKTTDLTPSVNRTVVTTPSTVSSLTDGLFNVETPRVNLSVTPVPTNTEIPVPTPKSTPNSTFISGQYPAKKQRVSKYTKANEVKLKEYNKLTREYFSDESKYGEMWKALDEFLVTFSRNKAAEFFKYKNDGNTTDWWTYQLELLKKNMYGNVEWAIETINGARVSNYSKICIPNYYARIGYDETNGKAYNVNAVKGGNKIENSYINNYNTTNKNGSFTNTSPADTANIIERNNSGDYRKMNLSHMTPEQKKLFRDNCLAHNADGTLMAF